MAEPVLIAGAGPVGLTLAMALRRLGVAVRIIDTVAARTDKSKALVIWPRTLELLEIQGCVQPFLDAGQRGTGARIFAHDRELVHVSLETARSRYNFTLFLPQSETERLLEEELARLGTQVERCVTLRGFTDDGEGVTATLLHPDGHEETARCHTLVGCDGAHSTTRHLLGIPFDGHTEPSDWLLADLVIDGDLPQDELVVCWQKDGILALFPIVGGRYRVIADTGLAPSEMTSSKDGPPPDLAEIQALLDARGPKRLVARDPVWLSRFRINERKVKEYRKGRVFLAGDSAHIHSPAGGQGMNTGMQDAFNLAWKLALVWNGRAGDALLDSYSPERSAIGDQVLRNDTQMTHVAILRNSILQEIRNLAVGTLGHIQALRQRLVDQLCELDLHYQDGPLTVPDGARHPQAGYRAPEIAVESGWLHDLLRQGRFVVLSVGLPGLALPPELAPIAMAAQAASGLDYEPGHHFLVRPDGTIALSARDAGPVLTFLRRLLP